jgi:hypothetical protein
LAYSFNFDLSRLSQSFFTDLAKFSERRSVHKKMGGVAQLLIRKFKVDKLTGLPVSDSMMVIEDLIDTEIKNLAYKEAFLKAGRKALILPHCSRKYMDCRCKASFDAEMSSYQCAHCSPDCLVNQATVMASKKNYDVYIVPGGSGIRNILQKRNYEGIVGVACTEEMKIGSKLVEHLGIAGQAVPLIKNGCSGTMFSLKTLSATL